MPVIWFTSDSHFGHARLIELDARRRVFSSVAEMDATLIARWNERVAPTDHCYHLGDFALCGAPRIAEIASQLNGKLFLLKGNHDHVVPKRTKHYSVEVRPDLTGQRVNGQKVVMCHYPLLVWDNSKRGSWMLHGHCHNNLKAGEAVKRLDVGVDGHDLYPWSFDEVKAYMEPRGIPTVDHHTVVVPWRVDG